MLSNHEPNRYAQPEPPDPMDLVETQATTPESGRAELVTYPEHPLFPLDDGVPETRDIQFVTFRRRRSDGRIDNCPEDVPRDKVTSWAEVVGPWGGGEYKAIGKDKNHRIVAWYPPEKGGWLLFDQPSKPFTLRDETSYGRAPDPPATLPPAAPALAPSHNDAMMLAMFNQAAETNRTILAAALSGNNNKESNTWELVRALKEMQPNPLDWLRAVREMLPAPAAAPPSAAQSLPEQLNTVKTILDWTRPPPAMPEPSILGELGGLVTSVIQTDAATRAATRSPDPPERRPPPPRPPRLFHVPGLGVVDLVQPEPALPPGLPAPARDPLSAAEPVAQPRIPVGHVDAAPKPAPSGIVMAPSTTRATRGPQDASDSGRDRPAPEVAPPPSDVDILLESLKRDPVALGKVLRALGVSPTTTVANVAPPQPATHAHRTVAAGDVEAPHVATDVASSTEPASPGGTLRPRLVLDAAPPSAAPDPAREARSLTPSPGAPGARTPAPHAVAADAPVRGTGGGSPGPDPRSRPDSSPSAQARALSPDAKSRAGQAHVAPPEPATPQARAPLASSTSQRVIELPAQMPVPVEGNRPTTREDAWSPPPGSELTAAEREQAAKTLTTVPQDKLLAHLKGIPGLAPHADDMVKALADLPAEAIPILVARLPPDDARALAAMVKNRKGG